MTRSVNVHGEAMIYVKGPQGSLIQNLTEFGLAESETRITVTPLFKDVNLNAWGEAPLDVQRKLAFITCTATMLQYDVAVMAELVRLATGGTVEGRLGRAGRLMGNGLGRFANGNNYVGFNLAAPQSGRPWRFLYAYLQSPIGDYQEGTNVETVAVTFRGVPYTADPWNGGSGASEYVLYDRSLDS